jgi:predicted amidohydrolase
MLRIGVVQTQTGIDPEANAHDLASQARELAASGADIIFTPEMSGLLDRNSDRLRSSARGEPEDPTLSALRTVAREHPVAIAIGSLALRDGDGPLVNRSILLGTGGEILARYDKMHLFDVDLPDGSRIRESASFRAGEQPVVASMPWGRLGLSICYDVRFPCLYQWLARAGAQVIAVPAAFTVPTGRAHWHVLLRARAIETGSFVVAAAQAGRHADGRETFGHALVVSPWGDILLDMGEEPGAALLEIDLEAVRDARARIPTLAHAKPMPGPMPIP